MQIEWRKGDETIRVDGRMRTLAGPVDQLLEWPGRPLIVVLLEPCAGPQRLLLLDADGQTHARLGPPADFDLYYIELDSRHGVTAVCSTETQINGCSECLATLPVSELEP